MYVYPPLNVDIAHVLLPPDCTPALSLYVNLSRTGRDIPGGQGGRGGGSMGGGG